MYDTLETLKPRVRSDFVKEEIGGVGHLLR
jgi:hypothetical protein